DAVATHHVAADARDAGVRLVVDEDVAAVVVAVGLAHVRVVAVAAGREVRPEHALALVGDAPADGEVGVEHRDAHQLAHRGHADQAHLAGLAAAPEAVVLVELAGRYVVGSGFVLAVLALAFAIVSGGGTFRATVVPLAT